MNGQHRPRILALTVLAALLMSALWTVPVLADDTLPPPPDAPLEGAPADEILPADTPIETETVEETAPVSEEAPPTEARASVDEVVTEVQVVEEAPRLDATPSELLEQLPEGTDLVVLDAAGEALPLASAEAVEIIAAADPMWCPVGVTPGGVACESSTYFNGPGGLLSLIVDKTVAGVIWVEDDYVGTTGLEGGTIYLDSSLGTTVNYALTIQGGWSGLNNTAIDTTDPSEFNVPISIDWNADITLNDIVITGVTGAFVALDVDSTQDINLRRVRVEYNDWAGALLNNSEPGSTGVVNVTNGTFRNNYGGTGLKVYSRGVITLRDVIANENYGDGAYLANDYAGTPAVNVFNTSTFAPSFSDNYGSGLMVYSFGSITVMDLDAADNLYGYGAYLNNNKGTGNVTLGTPRPNWVNVLSGNGDTGLVIFSRGTITIKNVWASDNDAMGAVLDNTDASSAKAVTVTNSSFNDNYYNGIDVFSKGLITLTDLDILGNECDLSEPGTDGGGHNGGWFDNTASTTAAGITMLGTNLIMDNEGGGLALFSDGLIKLNNVYSNGNPGGSGAYIDNTTGSAGVTITGTNEFNMNARGLWIRSNGAITLNNITASFNMSSCTNYQCGGAHLWNADSATSAGITLTGINTFRGNGMTGLQIYSKGVITLNNIGAGQNGFYQGDDGLPYFDEYFGNGAYIDNTYATTPKAVNILGTNWFWSNAHTGLEVYSKGAITVNNLTGGGNGWYDSMQDLDPNTVWGDGAYLDTCLPDIDGHCTNLNLGAGIKLTGTNYFGGNWDDGAYLSAIGPIAVNNVTADDNGWNGIVLDNNWDYWSVALGQYVLPKTPATITGYATANNNGYRGIGVYSTGVITVTNLTANNNGGVGARIGNAADPDNAKNVTITGYNEFFGNGEFGLKITSSGAITISNITASNNGWYDSSEDLYYGYGAWIENDDATLPHPIILSGSNTFDNNTLSGLEVYGNGAITVSNLMARWNGWYSDEDTDPGNVYGYGALLINTEGAAPVNVTGTNYFESNWNTGLHVESLGNITVANLTSRWNGQENGYNNDEDPYDSDDAYGAYLVTDFYESVGNISITGYALIEGNIEMGLVVVSNGNISLANLEVRDNGNAGAILANGADPLTPKTVTMTGTNRFTNNGFSGLAIWSHGAITLNNVTANWNGGLYNALVDNCLYEYGTCITITPAAIKITGTNEFAGNWDGGTGLEVYSFGSITISNLSVYDNNSGPSEGAIISNKYQNQFFVPSPGTLTLTGYASFWNNGALGLIARSNGNITIANLDASNNEDGGAYIDALNPSPVAVAKVTITGYANFYGNSGSLGLHVYADGAITITNLTADENWDASGAVLDNRTYGSSNFPQPVTLSGYSNFWHNLMDGLRVFSWGAVSIANINASENGIDSSWSMRAGPQYGWGLYINNTNTTPLVAPGVTLTGFNNFYSNWNTGLEIYSAGAVTLANLNIDWNGTYYAPYPDYEFPGSNGTYVGCGETINNGDSDFYVGCGAYIDNTASIALLPPGVTIAGANYFTRNGHMGLMIYSNGLVSLSNITANENGYCYDWRDDCNTSWGNGTGIVSYQRGLVISGTNEFSNNWYGGLVAHVAGPITVNNLTANNNKNYVGARLENQDAGPHFNVTITGYSSTNGNFGNGLQIDTHGNVSLTNLVANSNGDNGVAIDAYDHNFSPASVTVTGTNLFLSNAYNGLVIWSDGAMTLHSLEAAWNGDNGVYLNNFNYTFTYWTPPSANRIVLTGINHFNQNGDDGLEFHAYGNVVLYNISANGNGNRGVFGDAYDETSSQGLITFTCGSIGGNPNYGYFLTAGGITVSGVKAFYNGNNLAQTTVWPYALFYRGTCP